MVEAFIGHDLANIDLYKEFEVSPQGEWVDLDVDRKRQGKEVDWLWNSGFHFKTRIDRDPQHLDLRNADSVEFDRSAARAGR